MPQTSHTRSPAGGDIADTVMFYEQQWAAAAKANEPEKVAPLLSEVFVEMDSDGSLYTRSQLLDRIKSGKWQVYELSDMKVMVHGSVAVVTGTWHGKGTLADGKTVDEHERWLDTWLKNGQWHCMASASTPIKM